jgi:hypothetical protein
MFADQLAIKWPLFFLILAAAIVLFAFAWHLGTQKRPKRRPRKRR